MKAFLSVLIGISFLTGCHHHRHKKERHIHEEHHHYYPETDLSNKNFVIEQDIDLHLDEMPQNFNKQ